jgi:hypothetical protein
MDKLLAQVEAEGQGKQTPRKERKAEAPSSKGKARQDQGEKKRQNRRNLTDAFLKFKKETPAFLRYSIAFHLLTEGAFLARIGAMAMTSPIPGSRFVGMYLLVKGVTYFVMGWVILIDLYGIFQWPEEQPERPDTSAP